MMYKSGRDTEGAVLGDLEFFTYPEAWVVCYHCQTNSADYGRPQGNVNYQLTALQLLRGKTQSYYK